MMRKRNYKDKEWNSIPIFTAKVGEGLQFNKKNTANKENVPSLADEERDLGDATVVKNEDCQSNEFAKMETSSCLMDILPAPLRDADFEKVLECLAASDVKTKPDHLRYRTNIIRQPQNHLLQKASMEQIPKQPVSSSITMAQTGGPYFHYQKPIAPLLEMQKCEMQKNFQTFTIKRPADNHMGLKCSGTPSPMRQSLIKPEGSNLLNTLLSSKPINPCKLTAKAAVEPNIMQTETFNTSINPIQTVAHPIKKLEFFVKPKSGQIASNANQMIQSRPFKCVLQNPIDHQRPPTIVAHLQQPRESIFVISKLRAAQKLYQQDQNLEGENDDCLAFLEQTVLKILNCFIDKCIEMSIKRQMAPMHSQEVIYKLKFLQDVEKAQATLKETKKKSESQLHGNNLRAMEINATNEVALAATRPRVGAPKPFQRKTFITMDDVKATLETLPPFRRSALLEELYLFY